MSRFPIIRLAPCLAALMTATIGCSSSTPTTTGGGSTPTQLAFTAQPSAVPAGTSIAPAVQVAVRDAQNNLVTTATNTITVSITPGTGGTGATLSGTTSAAATAGVATFSNLTINKAASGFTLTAAASGLTSATSGTFAVAAGAAASVARQAGDSQTVAVSTAVPVAPAVVVRDALGNAKSGATVTFAVAGGGGAVTAGSQTTNASGIATVGSWTLGGSAGANTLTATVTGSGITGNPVTFTATATSGGGGGGATLLFAEGFEDANLVSRQWYDTPNGTGVATNAITTSEHDTVTGSTASLLVNFQQGASNTTPNPPVAARHQFTPSASVYLRYWVKYDTNWVGSGKPYHPHEFYFLSDLDGQYAGPASNYLTTYVEHNWSASAPAGGYAVLEAQDVLNIDQNNINVDLTGITENRAVAGCNGVSDAASGAVYSCYATGGTPAYANGKSWKSASPAFLPRSGWHKVEAYFQMNTVVGGIGLPDGIAQYWIDGTLLIDKRDVLFRTGAHPNLKFGQLLMGPYIGDGAPVTERAWYDDLVVMTAHP